MALVKYFEGTEICFVKDGKVTMTFKCAFGEIEKVLFLKRLVKVSNWEREGDHLVASFIHHKL